MTELTLDKKAVEKRDGNTAYVVIDNTERFDVTKIFDCGQCFRFDENGRGRHNSEFSGVAFGRFISVGQDGDTVYLYNSTLNEYGSLWKHYLALDADYAEIERDIVSRSNNPALASAVEFGRGIRILRQDRWEAICSFIISQNNNIPRIKKIIDALSARCGSRIEVPRELNMEEREYYSFPSPRDVLKLGVGGLTELRTGFRAGYIYDAADKIVSGQIDLSLPFDSMSTEECVKYLCSIRGVGPKVASCALLFAFEKNDAFPIDVWIKKVIAKYFCAEGEDIGSFDPSVLGPYAGIAQQFLFYYERYGGGAKE